MLLLIQIALGCARDELALSSVISARRVQAAVASAASFAVGAALPLAVALLVLERTMLIGVAGMSQLFLAALGVTSARAGGAPIARATARVVAWGALAMAATAGVGALFGGVV